MSIGISSGWYGRGRYYDRRGGRDYRDDHRRGLMAMATVIAGVVTTMIAVPTAVVPRQSVPLLGPPRAVRVGVFRHRKGVSGNSPLACRIAGVVSIGIAATKRPLLWIRSR